MIYVHVCVWVCVCVCDLCMSLSVCVCVHACRFEYVRPCILCMCLSLISSGWTQRYIQNPVWKIEYCLLILSFFLFLFLGRAWIPGSPGRAGASRTPRNEGEVTSTLPQLASCLTQCVEVFHVCDDELQQPLSDFHHIHSVFITDASSGFTLLLSISITYSGIDSS